MIGSLGAHVVEAAQWIAGAWVVAATIEHLIAPALLRAWFGPSPRMRS